MWADANDALLTLEERRGKRKELDISNTCIPTREEQIKRFLLTFLVKIPT